MGESEAVRVILSRIEAQLNNLLEDIKEVKDDVKAQRRDHETYVRTKDALCATHNERLNYLEDQQKRTMRNTTGIVTIIITAIINAVMGFLTGQRIK